MNRITVPVQIRFDTSNMSDDEYISLLEAQTHLRDAGIKFDSGGGRGQRHWSFDYSLRGSVMIFLYKQNVNN